MTFTHNTDVSDILNTFNIMVNECIEYALKNNITSPIKLRKRLYYKFKQKYGLATLYYSSACRVGCSAIKSWKRLVKKGRADKNKLPAFKARAMRLHIMLLRFKGDRVVLTIRPYEWIEIPLRIDPYHRQFIEAWERGELKVGEITLLEDRVIVPFKKEVEEVTPRGYASIDVNLMSLDILKAKDGKLEYQKVDLKKLYGIRVHYFKKRRKIQKLSKYRPKIAERLMQKYHRRERNRVKDILHKLTTAIAREFVEEGISPIFENLRHLRYNALRSRRGKRLNRKISTLPYRKIQAFIEYKIAWHGYKTYYVSPRNTSRTCPRCGSLSQAKGQVFRCKACGFEGDRHLVACLNILKMWGVQVPPESPREREEVLPQNLAANCRKMRLYSLRCHKYCKTTLNIAICYYLSLNDAKCR